jgi:Xaa-Pro aminopeptidase
VLRGGAEGLAIAWDPMIPSGVERTQLCMNRNSLRQVGEGELIDLQAGAVYEGYNAALCTPIILGKVPPAIHKAVTTANHAMAEVLGALKPGASTRAVNITGRNVIEQGGYGGSSPYGMIHTTGLLECESPWLPVDKDFELRPGMTMCIDIFLFRLPFGSFRIEDTVVITEKGVERLTSFNRDYLDPRYA